MMTLMRMGCFTAVMVAIAGGGGCRYRTLAHRILRHCVHLRSMPRDPSEVSPAREGIAMTDTTGDAVMARTASGAMWTVGFRLLTRLLGLISTLVLVRLLGPGDFGLVALGTNFAVHEAIVREPAPTRALYNTAFTMSLLRGMLTAGVVACGSPYVAMFLHEPRLANVLLALAASTLIASVENIATADFMRKMQFRQEFQLWTLPRILGVVSTIGVALIWPSYWALVCGIIVSRVARTVQSYAMYPYMPALTLSAWRRIVGFTTWSWAIYMVAVLRDKADTVLVGRFFSSASVGIFSLGHEIAALPISDVIEPVSRVCFPSFVNLRDAGLGVGQAWLRLLAASGLLVLPAGMGIALIADPLVKLAFGPGWAEAIPMIEILAISSSAAVVGSLTATLFSAMGMLHASFAIVTAATLARVTVMLIFLPAGSLVTAASLSAGLMVSEQIAYSVIAMRRFHVPLTALIAAVWRSFAGTLAMAGVLTWAGLGFTPVADSYMAHMLITALAGSAVYAATLWLTWMASGRPDGPERDMLTLLTSLRRRLVKFLPA
jgi:O-antigen/teichoic acid export membrane protein